MIIDFARYLERYPLSSFNYFISTSRPANTKREVIPICDKNLKSGSDLIVGSKIPATTPIISAVIPEGNLNLKRIFGSMSTRANIARYSRSVKIEIGSRLSSSLNSLLY